MNTNHYHFVAGSLNRN